jgi:hypothetical protein
MLLAMLKTPSFIAFSRSFLVCLFLACTAHAQSPPPPASAPPKEIEDSQEPNSFWQATLEGGHYMVALERICSVSRHQYVLDGAAIVDEVTVDASGQAIARFYFIKPITDAIAGNAVTQLADRGQELLTQAAERSDTDVQNMVVKKYPLTTHARTIEFRLLSESDLTSLYASVRTAWESGKGRKFSNRKK